MLRSRRTKIVATISPHTISRITKTKLDSLKASDYDRGLRSLVDAGVDVFRLNMSYRKAMGDVFFGRVFEWFRKNRGSVSDDMTILADLQGPKIRLGTMAKPFLLRKGEPFRLYFGSDSAAKGKGTDRWAKVILNNRIFKDLGEIITKGLKHRKEPITIGVGDSGALLVVENLSQVHKTNIECRVKEPGLVASDKGVMPKAIQVDVITPTRKDIADLRFLLKLGREFVSFVALSFVRSVRDLIELKYEINRIRIFGQTITARTKNPERKKILRQTLTPSIIAKIETVESVDSKNLDAIIDIADAIMVARGDLGQQLDQPKIPEKQKDIIELCRYRGKPVITATQMLKTMTDEPSPTRSELADVFNSVLDGTDATMLSGETASGRYPLEAVKTMASLLQEAESFRNRSRLNAVTDLGRMRTILARVVRKARARLKKEHFKLLGPSQPDRLSALITEVYREKRKKTDRQMVTDAICQSAWSMTKEVVGIIAATTSGRTARMLSRLRSEIPIFGVTHDDENRRKLLLSYGVYPVGVGLLHSSTDELRDSCLKELQIRGFLVPTRRRTGELVLFVSGSPGAIPGTTDQLRLISLPEYGLKMAQEFHSRSLLSGLGGHQQISAVTS